MEKKKKEKIVVYGLYVALLIGFGISIRAFIVAPDLSQKFLAFSVAVAIGGCGINMWIFSQSKEKSESEIEELKEANRLMKKQMKKERVIEMINKFIHPLIDDFKEKIGRIDNSLSGQQLALSVLSIKIDDKYVDILGDDYELIKKKVEEYNKLVMAGRLEEAKEMWANFKNKLGELKRRYISDFGIPEDKIKGKPKSARGLI